MKHQRLRRLQHRTRDAHAFFAFLDLKFGDPGRFDEVDQRLELAQIHGIASCAGRANEAVSLPQLRGVVQKLAAISG
jgi:hypothetical protein